MTVPVSVMASAPVLAHHEIEIYAPAETVWDIHVHVNEWPSWQADIADAALEGPFETGARFTWTSYGFTVTSTVYSLDECARILWGGTADGITGIHEWTFRIIPRGVHVTTTESFSGPPVEADAAALQELLDTSLVSWLAQLKAEAEARD